ncbi:endonuclease III [candidate division TA06 bacterium]|uniref:Endonuclease III n=1 Tax=candidate division TA06 bacterium TaxID=2250710 RepID=A0A933I9T4_UNCT6|nr:endonuclease III [candidate division TA06 bacterium]
MKNKTRTDQISRVHRRLIECYGLPAPKTYHRILDALIETILSQNTSDINSHRAHLSLKKRFPGWKEAVSARPQAIATVIRTGGLAGIKSRRISKLLKLINEEQGLVSLEYLKKLSPEQAYHKLLSYDGVGPKTAACTLLFGAGMPVFPVDTHVYRVCQRLGWARPKESAESFQERIGVIIPPAQVFNLHVNLISHGRQTCQPRLPDCSRCCLREYCKHLKDSKPKNLMEERP